MAQPRGSARAHALERSGHVHAPLLASLTSTRDRAPPPPAGGTRGGLAAVARGGDAHSSFGLNRGALSEGMTVVEVNRPNRQLRRSHGKSDPVDAVAAARAAQSGQAAGQAKTRNGAVEAIRALRVARCSAGRGRSTAINQMRALLVSGPDDLRETLRGSTISKLVTTAERLGLGHGTRPP